jgi:PPOX class probable F420-dependent enzyme
MTSSQSEILSTPWVISLLTQPILARLGTCNPKTAQPHVTPVWFAWDGECVLISGFISTRKFREIERNPRVSILVDTGNPGEETRGVLFEGQAELIADPAEVSPISRHIYAKYAGSEGLTDEMESWAVDPENRIIRLKPAKVYAW